MADQNPRGPGVLIPPPLLFVVGFLIAWLVGRIYPLTILPHRWEGVFGGVGLGIAAVGVATAAWGMFTFARARTAIVPIRRASRLVEHGPYRFTRNPMYTGLTLAYLGLMALFNSGWALLILAIVLVALKHLVIDREETYLQREFGADYDAYRRRVRRWI
jgi:protein-S-isoprenylcysteine O-methyltransferase Ste14